jgi:hypothetical protein
VSFFLVIYDRRAHRLTSLEAFGDDYESAAKARNEAEHAATGLEGEEREVVLLEAESVDVLTHTHSRYFVDGRRLPDQIKEAVESAA